MLHKNELLIDICNQLDGRKPNWDNIVQRFKRTPTYSKKRYNFPNLVSDLSEIYLRVSLEEICSNDSRVVFDPINKGEATENFFFSYDRGGKFVVLKENYSYSEIDQLILVDDLPVLFEIKLERNKHRGKKRGNPGRWGLNYSMRDERIRHLLSPINEYFERDLCGYVLVMLPEIYNLESRAQKKFLDSGGVIVPFYTDKKSYNYEVFGIGLKEKLIHFGMRNF